MKNVIIIGGGITGLSLAYYLRGKANITLLEASDRLGGWIQTDRIDDFLFDRGPHSLRTQAALELAQELGLEISLPAKAAKKRFLWTNGQLQALPTNPLGLFTSPIFKGLKRAIWRERKVPPTTLEDESVAAFFTRRFGEKLTRRLIDPITTGIFAGDIDHLSMRHAFGRMWDAEKKYGSLLRGMRKCKGKKLYFSFPDGMEALPRALAHAINADVHLNTPVTAIGPTSVTTPTATFEADHIYSTLPLPALAPLLDLDVPPLPHTTVATLSLGYSKQVLPTSGFGYLIPTSEKQRILGVLFPSEVYPDQNRGQQTRLTVMLGGAHHPECAKLPLEDLKTIALEELERHLGLTTPPDTTALKHSHNAIPHFPVGYTPPASPFPTLTLLGTSFAGTSVGECITSTKQAITNI